MVVSDLGSMHGDESIEILCIASVDLIRPDDDDGHLIVSGWLVNVAESPREGAIEGV